MSIQAQTNPIFQPAMRIITNITNADPCVVTTSFNNQFLTGTIVRIDLPSNYGMQQINQQYAPITVINSTTFSMAIDTSMYDAFIIPSPQIQYAQVVPIGSLDVPLVATVNVLNPNVPGGLPI